MHREKGREGDEIEEKGRRRGVGQGMRGEQRECGGEEGGWGREEEGVIALGPGQEGCK